MKLKLVLFLRSGVSKTDRHIACSAGCSLPSESPPFKRVSSGRLFYVNEVYVSLGESAIKDQFRNFKTE